MLATNICVCLNETVRARITAARIIMKTSFSSSFVPM